MSETILNYNTKLDQSDMRGAITEFPNQIKKSFSIMNNWVPYKKYQNIQNISKFSIFKLFLYFAQPTLT